MRQKERTSICGNINVKTLTDTEIEKYYNEHYSAVCRITCFCDHLFLGQLNISVTCIEKLTENLQKRDFSSLNYFPSICLVWRSANTLAQEVRGAVSRIIMCKKRAQVMLNANLALKHTGRVIPGPKQRGTSGPTK